MDERDEVHEALAATARVGAATLAQLGAHVARSNEQRALEDGRRAERDAIELQERTAAVRDAARLSYVHVHEPGWWETAQPEQVADAHATATAWRGLDPVAEQAVAVIERELETRHGIAQGDLGPDTASSSRVSPASEAAEAAAALDAAERTELDGVSADRAIGGARADRETAAGVVAGTSGPTSEQVATEAASAVSGDRDQTAEGAATPSGSAGDAAPAAPGRGAMGRWERVRRQLDGASEGVPRSAAEARLTAAYGEGRPAKEILAPSRKSATGGASGPEPSVRPTRRRSVG